jgi:hypothetical protein
MYRFSILNLDCFSETWPEHCNPSRSCLKGKSFNANLRRQQPFVWQNRKPQPDDCPACPAARVRFYEKEDLVCSGALLGSLEWPCIDANRILLYPLPLPTLKPFTAEVHFHKITLSLESMQAFIPRRSMSGSDKGGQQRHASSEDAQSFSQAQNVCKLLTLPHPHLPIVVQSHEVQLVVQSVGDVPRVHIPSDDGSRHVKRTPWPQDRCQVGDPDHRLIPVRKA